MQCALEHADLGGLGVPGTDPNYSPGDSPAALGMF